MSSFDPSETETSQEAPAAKSRIWKRLAWTALVLVFLSGVGAVGGAFYARNWIRRATREALPQIDGQLAIPGLSAQVTVQRDAQGVPHLRAANIDDLMLAQGFVTAQDRLWQMDMLRRHAAGELAAVLGPSLLEHDKIQRTLRIRAVADNALQTLPADQLQQLTQYAKGVNAAIEQLKPLGKRENRLPIEFRILRYEPAPWTVRDSLLVSLAMTEDLTNRYQDKLAREALTARLPPELVADLYPVGSWRDHPPGAGVTDLTVEGPPIEDIPLDESQSVFALAAPPLAVPPLAVPGRDAQGLAGVFQNPCRACVPGSNEWVIAGSKTASGKPMLSNDMHLGLTLPGIWYEVGLQAATEGEPFDVVGVSIPGAPYVVAGHNRHVAWGFTNLGADVQDVYIEQVRGSGSAMEFATGPDSWQPVQHHAETIEVHGGKPIVLDVTTTKHGDAETPILTPILKPVSKKETRALALRWTIYDAGTVTTPFLAIDAAHDWASFTEALSHFNAPATNVVYGDDQGHIGYHATGLIPMRGPRLAAAALPVGIAAPTAAASGSSVLTDKTDVLTGPGIAAQPAAPAALTVPMASGPLSAMPVVATAANEWSGYIPFADLPQVFDPVSGILATANSRTAVDAYQYPITLDWGAPYRNERIWRHLIAHDKLKPADMLALEADVYSEIDHVLAQKLAYGIDHSAALTQRSKAEQKRLGQAADLMRGWNGRMDASAAAPAIVWSAKAALWRLLLQGHVADGGKLTSKELDELYVWGERDYALEQMLQHTPMRWLPRNVSTWDDLLADAVAAGLADEHAPGDLSKWQYGKIHTVDVEHPVFAQSRTLRRLLGLKVGTGPQPISGDTSTIKQVGAAFGPSERFTVDFGDLDHGTLNIVLGQSGNPASPWFLNQFPAWYRVTTFPLPFTGAAVDAATTHTLTLKQAAP